MTSLARVELTSEKPQWFEWTVFMEAGYEPEVRFRNGPLAAKRMVRVLTTLAADKPEIKPFVDMKGGTEKAHGCSRRIVARACAFGKFKWKARTLRLGQPAAIVRCTAI